VTARKATTQGKTAATAHAGAARRGAEEPAPPPIALWPRGRDEVEIFPDFLDRACEYDADIFVDHIRTWLYFERTGLFDVLYERNELDGAPPGDGEPDEGRHVVYARVAAIAPPEGRKAEAVLRMLGPVLRSQSGHAWPRRYVAGDLLSQTSFERVLEEIDDERKALRAAAERQRGSELVRAAQALGLDPQPTGNSAEGWYVNCPTRRPHRASARPKDGTWGCGYCRIGGGVQKLREGAARRRRAAGAPRARGGP
jgi:hypothetical protein